MTSRGPFKHQPGQQNPSASPKPFQVHLLAHVCSEARQPLPKSNPCVAIAGAVVCRQGVSGCKWLHGVQCHLVTSCHQGLGASSAAQLLCQAPTWGTRSAEEMFQSCGQV